jgi:hypothetical protein
MSSNEEPFESIELDLDYCSRTFGVAPCTAALGGSVAYKCFNTFFTCADQENYDKIVKTYKFVTPRSNYPKGQTTFPCLVSVSGSSAKANIAGSDERMYGLGERGKITATFTDFPYHDRFCDKYQSERISGAAQLSGVGYNPKDVGTFWGRLRARNPNYAGRPMRKVTGYIKDGVVTITSTRHFIITEMKVSDNGGRVTVTGKDILKLADDDKAVAPAQSRAKIDTDIDTATVYPVFNLTPAGIAASDGYPTSGFAAIGSEIIKFTRSGDTITVTERGVSGTSIASHSVDDTFQLTFSPRRQRIDDVIYDLLVNYAGIDPSFITFADWQQEVSRWAPSTVLTTDILKPTGVASLIEEITVAGVTIWWDDVNQKIRLRMNRPVDTDTLYLITDDNAVIEASQEDRDDERITDVIFNTVQIDPSRNLSDNNFSRGYVNGSIVEKLPQAYGDVKFKTVNFRWFNHGDDANARILSLRLLDRFRRAPVRTELTVDYKDNLEVADVVDLRSNVSQSPTGELQQFLSQVTMREDVIEGHRVKLTMQRFPFDKRYAYITENTRPVYSSSTAAQKARGAYMVDEGTLLFGDGTGPYVII